MNTINRKQQILEESLKLFSVNGYEATSIAQISEAVGIRKASIYAHFDSKQEILDKLFEEISSEYEKKSSFARIEWDNPDSVRKAFKNYSTAGIKMQIQNQIKYALHDPHVSSIRRFLIVEQYRNSKIADYLSRKSHYSIISFCRKLMENMISEGLIKDMDPEVMASQFVLPISQWMEICDRYPKREKKIMKLIGRHIEQFFTVYQA